MISGIPSHKGCGGIIKWSSNGDIVCKKCKKVILKEEELDGGYDFPLDYHTTLKECPICDKVRVFRQSGCNYHKEECYECCKCNVCDFHFDCNGYNSYKSELGINFIYPTTD